MGNLRPGGFLAVMVDGRVEFFPNTLHDDIIRALICRDDGMDVRQMMPAGSLPR